MGPMSTDEWVTLFALVVTLTLWFMPALRPLFTDEKMPVPKVGVLFKSPTKPGKHGAKKRGYVPM